MKEKTNDVSWHDGCLHLTVVYCAQARLPFTLPYFGILVPTATGTKIHYTILGLLSFLGYIMLFLRGLAFASLAAIGIGYVSAFVNNDLSHVSQHQGGSASASITARTTHIQQHQLQPPLWVKATYGSCVLCFDICSVFGIGGTVDCPCFSAFLVYPTLAWSRYKYSLLLVTVCLFVSWCPMKVCCKVAGSYVDNVRNPVFGPSFRYLSRPG